MAVFYKNKRNLKTVYHAALMDVGAAGTVIRPQGLRMQAGRLPDPPAAIGAARPRATRSWAGRESDHQ